MKKNITIDIPEGYSDVKYNSETGHVEFIKKDDKPHSWKEFCANYPTKEGEAYVCYDSVVDTLLDSEPRDLIEDRNLCVSEIEAKAFLALMQLRQLRKAWIKDWEPNWCSSTTTKYCIGYVREDLKVIDHFNINRTLSFPSYKMAKEFLKDFRDLIKLARPLL